MDKQIIRTAHAPAPIGPYQQAIKAGHLVFTSGQIPIRASSGELVTGGIEEQTRCVLENVKAVLQAAGSSLGQVVKTTVFLKSMDDFPAMNTVYAEYFPSETAPARSTVEVARLPKHVAVEIEAVATT